MEAGPARGVSVVSGGRAKRCRDQFLVLSTNARTHHKKRIFTDSFNKAIIDTIEINEIRRAYSTKS